MVQRFNLLQKLLVLSHALNSVIDSDTFISSIERIRKNSQYTKDSKCGLDFAKSLMDLMYAMAENAQQILDHLDFVSQQERALYPYECTVKPFSDKDRTIIECAAFSQRDWLMFFYRLELPKTQLLINASNKEEILTYEKLSKDIKAQEVLGGIADIFATLNLAWNITEHMHDILSEITKDKLDSILYLPLEAYVYAIMDKRKRIYRYMFDNLKNVSNYSINTKIILKSQKDEYKGRNLLELMNYDVVFMPKPAFGQLPNQITFIYKSGSQKVLFQR